MVTSTHYSGVCCTQFRFFVHHRPQTGSPVDVHVDNVGIRSNILGNVVRLGGEDDSFLNAMGVPTFASLSNFNGSVASPANNRARGLECALRQGPAFALDNVLSKNVCENLIETCEEIRFGSYIGQHG